jgi:hypothetical protein
MSRHAFRTVHPTQCWSRAPAEPATYDGPFHRAGDRVVYAWSQSELSAMSLAFLCAGINPVEMLWEKLLLPSECNIVDLAHNESVSPDLMVLLRQRDVLGAWVPTSLSSDGMALVMNPAHPQFSQIKVLDARFIRHAPP